VTPDASFRLGRWAATAGLAAILGGIAAVASPQRLPDSYYYERIAAQTIVPGCAEIHCFRPLVPWTLGLLPPTVVKWKAYAALCNAGAALAVFDLCLLLGMTARAALLAGSLSAFGFGSLYTLFEPFTGDPLMFLLGPLVTRWALQDRMTLAGGVATLGVFAKEFVVAPIVIVALAAARAGRRVLALRDVRAASVAFVVWLGLQLFFMSVLGYTYGDNHSPKIFEGGYVVYWLRHESLAGSAAAMFVEFGALYLLIPFGFFRAPRELKGLAVAAIPIALIFGYVQQPDRALWNFHYLATPLSALVLETLPNALAIAFVLSFALADLRIGAQVSGVPEARYALTLTVVLAVVAIVADRRRLAA
jgi:hypothetical protein